MRARYSAYVTANETFLRSSWHPDTRPGHIQFDPRQRWLGLTIKDTEPVVDQSAVVEFVARYKIDGRGHRLHERSRFEYLLGQWLYVDGELMGETNPTYLPDIQPEDQAASKAGNVPQRKRTNKSRRRIKRIQR